MKKIIIFVLLILIAFPACKARYSFNTREGKKKLKHYNSIPYKGYPTNPKSKK